MAEPSFDELLDVPDVDTILEQEVLTELRKPERAVKVDSWPTGGVYRAMAYIVAKAREQGRKIAAAIAAAGFEDYAFGLVDPPFGLDVTSWAPIVAKQRYGLDRIEATYTRRTIRLTNSTASTYGPLTLGTILLGFSSGNRYIQDEDAITIPASDYIDVIFRSALPTDSVNGIVYSTDPSDDVISFINASYPGVTATNPATVYSVVSPTAESIGTVTPSNTPSGGAHSVAVRIDASGNAGDSSVAWSTNVDGLGWVAQSGATATNLGGFNIDVTLADNAGDPAFAADTIYYFNTPGTDIVEIGRDVETPQELGRRCRALWPLLAMVPDDSGNSVPISPTAVGYELLARTASRQVKVVYVGLGDVNNELKLAVAGQGALLPGATVAAIQAYLDVFPRLTDIAIVLSPTTRVITIANLAVTVRSGYLVKAQAEVQRRLRLFFGGVDANNPLAINGLIDHAYVAELVRTTPGVKKITDLTMTINGSTADLQLPVVAGALELATWSQTAATDFAWRIE